MGQLSFQACDACMGMRFQFLSHCPLVQLVYKEVDISVAYLNTNFTILN